MKETFKFSTVMLLTMLMSLNSTFAAGATQKIPSDSMQLGVGASSTTKSITFDANLGASNPKITVPMSSKDFNFNKAVKIANDLLKLGDGTVSASKVIEFDIGSGGTNPKIRWNTTLSSFEFSTDGTNYTAFGTGTGGGTGLNLLTTNPDFEQGISNGWTSSGGTYAAAAGTDILFGTGSATFTASATGQYLQSNLYTIPEGLVNQPCVAAVAFKGGDANWQLQVLDASSNLIAYKSIPAATTKKSIHYVPFNCGASGSQYRWRLISTGAAAKIALDKAHLGEQLLQQFSTASNYAIARVIGNSTCTAFKVTNTGGASTYANMVATGTCNGVTNVSGNAVSMPNVLNASFTLPNVVPGVYTFTLGGFFQNDNTVAGAQCFYRFFDGTNGFGRLVAYNTGTLGTSAGPLVGSIEFTTPGTKTITIQSSSAGNHSCYLLNDAARELQLDINYAPSANQSFYTPETLGWRVDANLYGSSAANMSLGLGAVSSYTEMGTSDLTLVQNTGSSSVGIACASGTTSVVGATTCAATRSNGITFNVPRAGTVRACVDFAHYYGLNAVSAAVVSAFEVVETNASNTTILQEGKGRVASGNIFAAGSGIQHNFMTPLRVCGTFVFTSAGQKTLRLMYEQSIGSVAPLWSQVIADADPQTGQRDIHWTVEPIDQQVPMPVMVGPWAQTAIKTSAYTAVPSDEVLMGDTSSAAFNFTLSSPSIAGIGKVVRIVKTNSGANLLGVTASIAGVTRTTYLHGQGENIAFISDGSTWQWLSDPFRTEMVSVGGAASTGTNCTASPCTVKSQSGNWIQTGQATRAGVGTYALNYSGSLFTAAPACSGSGQSSGNNIQAPWVVTPSTTGMTIVLRNTASTAVDGEFDVLCRGPR